MGRIPDETIDTIRDRLDLLDLVGRYVSLRKSGRSYKGLCPFHDEKTPSFFVNPERRVFHCYGCGASGDAFEFLMRHDNLTFREAAESAARECGVEIRLAEGGDSGELAQLVTANEVAQGLYRSALVSAEGEVARRYLEGRGLDARTCQTLGVGFAPDRWDAVTRGLAAARIAAPVGARAGLLAERRSGGHYDRLRGRITFPIQDARGRLIGFGGRAIRADQEPKYLNTPESPLFRKRESFYGFPFALEPMRRRERAVVVEGYFDRIALHRAGLEESIATCGTALGPDHARQLRRRTRNVVLVFDGDEAGRRAVRAALEVLLPAGLRVHAATLPAGEDPDSFLAREGAEALRALIESARPALELVIREAVEVGVSTPFAKADAVAAVAPFLARVPGAIERSEYTRRLALAAGVDARDAERAVGEALGEAPAERDAPRAGAPPNTPELRFARRIAELLMGEPALVRRLRPGEPETLVADPRWSALLRALAGACRSGAPLQIAGVAEQLGAEERRMLLALACSEDPPVDPEMAPRILDDTLEKLRERRRAEERRELTRRIADEQGGDPRALLVEKQRQLEKRRAALGLEARPPVPSGGVDLLQ